MVISHEQVSLAQNVSESSKWTKEALWFMIVEEVYQSVPGASSPSVV